MLLRLAPNHVQAAFGTSLALEVTVFPPLMPNTCALETHGCENPSKQSSTLLLNLAC